MTDDGKTGVFAVLRATPTPVRYLLGGMLVNQLGAFVQNFLILYLTFRGTSVGVAGICLAAYSVGSIFGTIAGGELTHRIGSRATIVAAMACSGPLVALIPFVIRTEMPWALFVVVALAGLVTQAYRPAAAVLLGDLMPEKHQVMGFSMMRIALNIGAAVASLIAAWLILVNWDLLFWVDGGTAILWSVLAFVLLPKQPPAERDEPEEKTAAPAASGRSAYATLIRDRRYLFYLSCVLLGTITYAQSTTALPLEIVSDGYPTGLYSVVLTISSVVLITCELKITTYIVKIPKSFAGLLGHVVNGVGFAIYGLAAQSSVFVILGGFTVVAGLMIGGPSTFSHPATFPKDLKARYMGTMQAVVGVASALGPPLGVYTWTQLGGPGFWVVTGVLTVIAGMFAAAGMKKDPKQDTPATVPEVSEPVPAEELVADFEPEAVGGKNE